MNILVTCLSKSWGGMEMFAISSLLLLIRDGYKVTAACVKGSKIHNELVKENIPVVLFRPSRFSIANIVKLSYLVIKKKFNLIHTHNSKDLWLIVPALKLIRSSLPVVLTKHLGSAVKKKDLLHNFLYKRLDHAIAISNVIKTNLLETTALTENKVSLINNYIDLDQYKKNPEARVRMRKEYALDDNTMALGVVSRITPGKGHEEIIDAVKILDKENLNFKVFVVGVSSPDEAKYEQGLKNKIKNEGLEKYFIFTGFRKDIPDLLSFFDIFIFPSRAEAFGLSLLEAMAVGLPNIVCFSDGVTDIAVKNETSLTFGRKESAVLANDIRLLLNNEELRKKLGQNSLKRASLFSDSLFQAKINNLYEWVVSNNGDAANEDKIGNADCSELNRRQEYALLDAFSSKYDSRNEK